MNHRSLLPLLLAALLVSPAGAVEKSIAPPSGPAIPALPTAEAAAPNVSVEAAGVQGAEAAAAATAAVPQLQSAAVAPAGAEAAAAGPNAEAAATISFDGARKFHGCAHCNHDHGADEGADDVSLRAWTPPAQYRDLVPSERLKNPDNWTPETTLHLHSVFSDGTMEPEAVMQLAYDHGVRDVALSDHDSVAGVMRAWKKAKTLGMRFHPAIELSARGGVHVGAVDLDITNAQLTDLLARVRAKRLEFAEHVVSELNKLPAVQEAGGITIDEVRAMSKHDEGGTIEVPHIARVLKAKGLIQNVDDAFDTYLKGDVMSNPNGTPDPTVDEVLAVIRAAGGKAFLNHPYTVRVSDPHASESVKDQAILAVLEKGFDGIEVYRPIHAQGKPGWIRADQRAAKYLGWADQYNLVPGNGADFHGTDTHLNVVEVYMPKALAAKLEDSLKDANEAAIKVLERLESDLVSTKGPGSTVFSFAAFPLLMAASGASDLGGTVVACLIAAGLGGLISVWMNRGR